MIVLVVSSDEVIVVSLTRPPATGVVFSVDSLVEPFVVSSVVTMGPLVLSVGRVSVVYLSLDVDDIPSVPLVDPLV